MNNEKSKKFPEENLMLKQSFKNQLRKALKESKSKKSKLLPLKEIFHK